MAAGVQARVSSGTAISQPDFFIAWAETPMPSLQGLFPTELAVAALLLLAGKKYLATIVSESRSPFLIYEVVDRGLLILSIEQYSFPICSPRPHRHRRHISDTHVFRYLRLRWTP